MEAKKSTAADLPLSPVALQAIEKCKRRTGNTRRSRAV
jgi:hypothetical protein